MGEVTQFHYCFIFSSSICLDVIPLMELVCYPEKFGEGFMYRCTHWEWALLMLDGVVLLAKLAWMLSLLIVRHVSFFSTEKPDQNMNESIPTRHLQNHIPLNAKRTYIIFMSPLIWSNRLVKSTVPIMQCITLVVPWLLRSQVSNKETP